LDLEKNLQKADNKFEQGPHPDDTGDEIMFVLASWSALLNSERAREYMRYAKLKSVSVTASNIRGLKQWWKYPLLFFTDACFLFDLYKNNNMVRLNDLLLSSVKYKTGLHLLAKFKDKSAVMNLVDENIDKYFVYRKYLEGVKLAN
jgi:hypothetical protein